MSYFIDKNKCKSCGICAELCDAGAISYPARNGTGYCAPRIDADLCIGCGQCIIDCPGAAIWPVGV